MHPMERLRYVARAGSGDTAIIVGETVEAIARLRPGPAELVTVCRQLVQRNPTCGPLWWLGARLLSGDLAGDSAEMWDLVDEVDEDPTADHLVEAFADDASVLVIGCPDITARALCRRGDVRVLAVDAGAGAPAFVRMLDRADVEVSLVDVTALPAAAAAADMAIVEIAACSPAAALVPMGNELLSLVAGAAGTPRYVVGGVGTRLPGVYLDAIAARAIDESAPWRSDVELVELAGFDPQRDVVVGPGGASPIGPESLRAECPLIPELIPSST